MALEAKPDKELLKLRLTEAIRKSPVRAKTLLAFAELLEHGPKSGQTATQVAELFRAVDDMLMVVPPEAKVRKEDAVFNPKERRQLTHVIGLFAAYKAAIGYNTESKKGGHEL